MPWETSSFLWLGDLSMYNHRKRKSKTSFSSTASYTSRLASKQLILNYSVLRIFLSTSVMQAASSRQETKALIFFFFSQSYLFYLGIVLCKQTQVHRSCECLGYRCAQSYLCESIQCAIPMLTACSNRSFTTKETLLLTAHSFFFSLLSLGAHHPHGSGKKENATISHSLS